MSYRNKEQRYLASADIMTSPTATPAPSRHSKDCDAVLCYGMGWRAAEDRNTNGSKPLVIDGEVTHMEAFQRFVAGNLKPASGYCQCHK
jgi:hypothetical protein